MTFRACQWVSAIPAGVGTNLQIQGHGDMERIDSSHGMSLYCFNRWCRKLLALLAGFLCGANAAGSCCGCKKTPYLGQIARNLSFAAAWIASRGHGK